MMYNNLNLAMLISSHIPYLVKFYKFVLKILSENGMVKSINGHISVINLQKKK